MSEKFLKFIPSEEANKLLIQYPKAFMLLCVIAQRAKKNNALTCNLKQGEAIIGDWQNLGLSRQEYRTALAVLSAEKYIQIITTNRTCSKIKKQIKDYTTTSATIVKLLDSRIWDLNLENINHLPTTSSTTKTTTLNNDVNLIISETCEEIKKDSNHLFNHQNNHKQRAINRPLIAKEEKRAINKKEEIAQSPFFQNEKKSPFFSSEQNENVKAFQLFWSDKGIEFSDREIAIWFHKFGEQTTIDTAILLFKRGKPIDNWPKMMQTALDKNYLLEHKNIFENLDFAIKFKAEKRWNSLRILKKYCVCNRSGNDYQFNLPIEVFKKNLTTAFAKIEENGL